MILFQNLLLGFIYNDNQDYEIICTRHTYKNVQHFVSFHQQKINILRKDYFADMPHRFYSVEILKKEL
jgi:hypothetical protein